MDAVTTSAIATCLSGAAAMFSALIAATSARHSSRSAQASEAALRETRRQGQTEDARRELLLLGMLHEQATDLIKSLSTDLRREPATVERRREALRRTLMISGRIGPRTEQLLRTGVPPAPAEVERVLDELARRADSLRRVLHEPDDAQAPGK